MLPPADLYVCTGDMLQNYPVFDEPADRVRIDGSLGYRIKPEDERIRQGEDVKRFQQEGGFTRFLGNPRAPVVCVRGNHDFIDLHRMFKGCFEVHELVNNELLELELNGQRIRITGHRGIPFIFGSWNDEVQRPDLIDRARRMPDADLFVTHYPPAGVLDADMPPGLSTGGGWAKGYGLEGMANVIIHKVQTEFQLSDDGLFDEQPPRAAHCFGHIHECGGNTLKMIDVIFSNAATTYNTFEIEPLESE